MDAKKFNKIQKKVRDNLRRYSKGRKFIRFCRRQQIKPAWWDLPGWYQYQKGYLDAQFIYKALADHGDFAIGLVLMRNSELNDKKAVAPVLIIASSDVSPQGFADLHSAAFSLEEFRAHDDPDIRRQVGEIFEDETYQAYRCRALPNCVPAPHHIRLYDEVMRGDDFFDTSFDGAPVTVPWALLLTTSIDSGNLSIVVPGKIGLPILQFLIKAQKEEESHGKQTGS